MEKSGGGDSRDVGPSSTPPTTTVAATSSSPASSSSVAPAASLGCGSSSGSGPPTVTTPMTLNVTTTTGGSFSVLVDGENSVENLKKIISKKLKVSKDRICLLHRERELHDGTLRENGLMDGSKLILTPNVETGLLAQRAENTVMQALESLNDSQVNDFLSGKSPLNLSVRLGDHMMLIQLQLSTLNPSSQNGTRSKTHKSRTITAAPGAASGAGTSLIQASSSRSHSRTTIPIGFRRVTTTENAASISRSMVEHVSEAQTLTKQEIDNIHSLVKNLAESDNPTTATVVPSTQSPMETESRPRAAASESPIKSLSNLVSSSINSNIPPACNNNTLSSGPSSPCADPISANLTSCLCKRLDSNDNHSCEPNCLSRVPEPQQPSTSTAHLHRTAHNPIARHKTKVQTLKKHISFDSSTLAKTELDIVHPVGSTSAPNSPQRPDHPHLHHHHSHFHQQQQQSYQQPQAQPQPGPSNQARVLNADPNSIENPALAEASRNLTQTLRKLSKRVFTNKVNDASQEAARNASSGAVIESMKHHGKGIYSGTFSGTLNPALQDKFGRPKRDISTIIHILNDLLSAAPQCARSGTKIYFEPSQTSAAAAAAASTAATTSGGTVTAGGLTTAGNSSSNLQAAAVMAPTTSTFTTPVAVPSPRMVSRCVPTPIQTKKYPSNGTITTGAGAPGSSCISCKPTDPGVPSTSGASPYGRCHHYHQKAPVARALCKCGLPLTTPTSSPLGQQCQRCAAISAAELENSKTKSKLDNLRLIMQQKKERREARKQKCAPYSMASHTSSSSTASSAKAAVSSGSTLEVARTSHRQLAASTTTAASMETMEAASAVVESNPAAAIDGTASESAGSDTNTTTSSSSSSSSNNGAASSATATATATTTTSATAAAAAASATSSEAAQSHQLVEEVDTVA